MNADVPERAVQVSDGAVTLAGSLHLPEPCQALVVFAHGSGSSRHSPRNQAVARALREAGLGTLLLDLLTSAEEAADVRTGHLRFNIEFLAKRVLVATDWALADAKTRSLRIGYFGASTGAAAALVAAAERPEVVRAVVSRGGRPDLAGPALQHVRAPTLLLVGSADHGVVELNQEALARLTSCTRELMLVRGATHLFEEPGALEEVARLATRWFVDYLLAPP